MGTDVINPAIETGKSIGDFGMMAITAGFFLVLSALMWVTFFRWFMKVINDTMSAQRETFKELLTETRNQNIQLSNISEGLVPETQMRIKTVTNMAFDLAVERVCRIIKRVREENHISDKEGTAKKIRQLLTNLHEDRNSKFDCFTFRGKKLSSYTNTKWIEQVAKVVESEIYNDKGVNNQRAFTNVEAAYAKIRLELYHNMMED